MDPNEEINIKLCDDDINIRFFSGTGKGGQHRNKHQCCVMMTHITTNITVKIEGRSKDSNIEEAKKIMYQRLKEHFQKQHDQKYSNIRNNQIDNVNKRRTYNYKINQVIDHVSNKTCTIKDMFKGNINILHY